MKRIKSFLGLTLVLAVLIGAVALVKTLGSNSGNAGATETEAFTVFALSQDTVEAISWTYTQELAFSLTEDGWQYAADPIFPLDESYIEAALNAVCSVSSTRVIENVTDWDCYGLETPVCTVTVTAAGAEYSLSIGGESGLGGQRYLSLGDGNVYLVDDALLESFSYGLYDLLTWESIPSMTGVTGVTLSSSEQEYSIIYEENSAAAYSDLYTWFMDGKLLDNELTEALIADITGLCWQDCVEYNAADLSLYGLDTPTASISVFYTETVTVATGETDDDGNAVTESRQQENVFFLHIGAEEDGSRYARLDGSNMVYLIDGELCQALLSATYSQLQPDEVILLNWEDVTGLRITLDGELYTVAKSTQTVTDEDGSESEKTVYLLNETEVAAETLFDALDSLAVTGSADGISAERSQELCIVFLREHAFFPEMELVFYQYDSSQCLSVLSGEGALLVSRADVVSLVETVTQMILSA